MVHIAYYTELNLQICNYAQRRRICRENSKYEPDFCGHFYPYRKATNFCRPDERNWPTSLEYHLDTTAKSNISCQSLAS